MKPLENPQSSMNLQVVPFRQASSPSIIDDYDRAKLRSLDDCLSLATILGALRPPFREEKIDGSLFVAVTTLKESVSVKEHLQSILSRSPFEEIPADGLGYEHFGEEKTQLRYKVEVVEGYDARAVNRAARRPHLESTSFRRRQDKQTERECTQCQQRILCILLRVDGF